MVHVYEGDGKGKTSSAAGMALRAAGHGIPVLFVQFLKDGSSGEILVLSRIPGVRILAAGRRGKFVSQMTEEEKRRDRERCGEEWETACRYAEELLQCPPGGLCPAGDGRERQSITGHAAEASGGLCPAGDRRDPAHTPLSQEILLCPAGDRRDTGGAAGGNGVTVPRNATPEKDGEGNGGVAVGEPGESGVRLPGNLGSIRCMLVLDEILHVLRYGWLPETELLAWLDALPEDVEVILTGRDAPQALVERADYHTVFGMRRHPLQRGIGARDGVER